MRKDFGKMPWIYPQPVLIIGTYDKDGKPDLMNAAWGGVGDDTQVFLCLDPSHKSTDNILESGEFTVSFGTTEYIKACDYVGIVSWKKDKDKVEKSGFTLSKGKFVNAPIVNELPLCLECKLISYEKEHCHLFGEIINCSCDEKYLTNGKPDPIKMGIVTFDIANHKYISLGEVVASAFSCGLELK